jgi:hypothetical protein
VCRFVISNVIYGKNVIYADTGSTLGATSPMRGNAIYVYGNPCGHPSRRPRYARALRMRAEIAEVHQTRALILRSMRAQHACVSKDGRTCHLWRKRHLCGLWLVSRMERSEIRVGTSAKSRPTHFSDSRPRISGRGARARAAPTRGYKDVIYAQTRHLWGRTFSPPGWRRDLYGRHLCGNVIYAHTSSMGSGHFRLFAGDVKRTSPMSSMRATSPMLTAGENY